MDPGVPVVHVAVEPDPVPVSPLEERLDDAPAGLGAHAGAQARVARVEQVSEHVVGPRELADDLARPRSRYGRSRSGTTQPRVAHASSCAGQHQEDCSHRAQTPSATSSTQASSHVTAAATTARDSRCCRECTSSSWAVRSPSRCRRAAVLADGSGHGVPRSTRARASTAATVSRSTRPSSGDHTERSDAGGRAGRTRGRRAGTRARRRARRGRPSGRRRSRRAGR